ncbi:DUF3784 domain-containing protein [Alistipes sp.]|uniref:DUF3784 domain-containing protein n=1 Tax=Alistipes sp. TaxID=1872444 RepID=UPI003AF1D43F
MHGNLGASLIAGGILVLFGILFLTGHGAGLIAGYNTLPEKERERYDKRALCRFMGKFMFYAAACVALIGADDLLPGKGLALAGGIWLTIGVVFMLVYANTKGRFLKK